MRAMWEDFKNWVEHWTYWAATMAVLVLVYRWFTDQPIVYGWNPAKAPETLIVYLIGGILLANIAYSGLKSRLTGEPWHPLVVGFSIVPVLVGSVLIGTVWLVAGPNAGANYIPLGTLVALSAWGSYAMHYGRFADRHHDRVRAVAGQTPNSQVAESDAGPARVSAPKTTFASIAGNDAIKARLSEAARAVTAPQQKGTNKPRRNGILLHGGPGNGKTAFAEALAGELNLPLVTLTYADVASQWVGEKSARVRQAFEQAKRNQPCVLFIDEGDSFLEARDGRGDGTKEDRDLVNALLTLMVDIREHRVILMMATNHMDRLDSAAVREGRFDFKVEITPPDLPARLGLLRKGLRENVPDVQVDETVIQSVAQRWNGFSVKRILAVTEELASYVRQKGLRQVGFDDFMAALRQLQGQRGHTMENAGPMEELVFNSETRDALEQIAARMEDPEFTEAHGGTLPTGVLFAGPPGTGKTATCKALAKKLGWAFLPATGADLARDPKKLDVLYP